MRKIQLSGLQILCQYQIPALLSGADPEVVLSDEYVAGVRKDYAQTSPSCIRQKQRVFNVGCSEFVGKAYR